ncbi:MAG: NirD/YgiW/YdeI family stress tolerance protein [Spirochaetaceae bacterium]|jgi:uncharacterized protein (TIGR00156 family)|nr:NirD/YgiW/YdeI family stress tolerance protein [Spirochaetaceae bacterium]
MKIAAYFIFLLAFVFFSCDLDINGGPPVYSISDANGARDGTPVVLEGTLGAFMGDEKWDFSDGTNSIPIEIDDEYWWRDPNHVEVGDTIIIYGEVEKEVWERTYINVDRIVKKK